MASALWACVIVVYAQDAGVVKEIIIRGNKRVSKEAILSAMSTKVGQTYSAEKLDRDKRSLEELGFFDTVNLVGTAVAGNDFNVAVNVSEFPEIKEIRVVGNSVVSTEEILGIIKPFMKPGDVFNRNSLRPASEAIKNLYQKKGFLEEITDFAPMKDSPNTVNLAIQEARVGKITVQGAKTTRDWVLRRLIKSRSGEPFSVTKWTGDLRRMQNTQWFESVKWVDDPNQEDLTKINLIADVKEQKTGQFNIGLQLDSSNSLSGIIKLVDTNFHGSGQTVGVNFSQSIIGGGPSVDFNYVNPFFDAKNTRMSISLYSHLIFRFSSLFNSGSPTGSNDQYNERHSGAAIGFQRPLNDFWSAGLGVRFEAVKTSNVQTTLADQFIQQDGQGGVFSFGMTENRRDRDIDATRGHYFHAEVEPGFAHIDEVGGAVAGADVLGNHTYVRSHAEYRAYFTDQGPIGRDFEATRRVLAVRMIAGTISGIVPYYEQFFVGGADTIRGYPEQRFWGRNELLGTAEIRYPLQKTFSLIGFVDYGDAWGGYGAVNNYFQSPNMQMHVGYGLGLSFRTPLGPIRVDLGFDDHGKSRTSFEIGTSF